VDFPYVRFFFLWVKLFYNKCPGINAHAARTTVGCHEMSPAPGSRTHSLFFFLFPRLCLRKGYLQRRRANLYMQKSLLLLKLLPFTAGVICAQQFNFMRFSNCALKLRRKTGHCIAYWVTCELNYYIMV
jgi:hypothetical protein